MRPTHKLKVEGASGFVRDMSNGAILYTKQEEVNEARHRKAQRLAKEDKIQKKLTVTSDSFYDHFTYYLEI